MSRPFADSDVFRALADPTRRRILELLRRADRSAGELHQLLSLTPPTISEHLRILRHVGLVEQHRTGRQRVYRLSPKPLRAITNWLRPFK